MIAGGVWGVGCLGHRRWRNDYTACVCRVLSRWSGHDVEHAQEVEIRDLWVAGVELVRGRPQGVVGHALGHEELQRVLKGENPRRRVREDSLW